MSYISVYILCFTLIGQLIINGAATSNDPNSSHEESIKLQHENSVDPIRLETFLQPSRSENYLDLIELTPSLEHQLYQAKRLNRADPDLAIDVGNLAKDAYKYEVAPSTQDSPLSDERPSLYLDGGSKGNQLKRKISTFANNNALYTNQRYLRGTNYQSIPKTVSPLMFDQDKEDMDYTFVGNRQPSASSVENQESATRKSLWTSELLRDLLFAQEARARDIRMNNLKHLARVYAPHRSTMSGDEQQLSQQQQQQQTNHMDQVEGNRLKRRRCKVDPNLGVKNPSFCDTDAYFGAADYSMRDVWQSAGR